MVAVVGATISPIYAVGFPICTGPLSSVYVCSAAVAAACTDSAGPGLPGAPTARVAGAPNVPRQLACANPVSTGVTAFNSSRISTLTLLTTTSTAVSSSDMICLICNSSFSGILSHRFCTAGRQQEFPGCPVMIFTQSHTAQGVDYGQFVASRVGANLITWNSLFSWHGSSHKWDRVSTLPDRVRH